MGERAGQSGIIGKGHHYSPVRPNRASSGGCISSSELSQMRCTCNASSNTCRGTLSRNTPPVELPDRQAQHHNPVDILDYS